MQYIIQEEDKSLIRQNNYKIKIRINILSGSGSTLGILTGVSEVGSFSIDADSDIRRTASFTVKLDDFYSNIEKEIANYLNLNFKLEAGVYNNRTGDYKYYLLGTFHMTETNTSYDASTNSLHLGLSDSFSFLNGIRNGQVGGSPTILIPVEHNGVKNTIRQAAINILTAETNITDYLIEDIGEYLGMPQNNADYLSYRQLNTDWNTLPYDLKFNSGDTVADILITLRDLYPNCQVYFDTFGNFCFDMIPSNETSPIVLSNDYLQSILVSNNSENVSYDTSAIRNVTEVFGKVYDIDRFCENSTYGSGIYNLTLEAYEKYTPGEIIGFSAVSPNAASPQVKINGLAPIPLYKEYTDTFIEPETIESGNTIAIKINKDNSGKYAAYYLGEFQPHALCVLTDNVNDELYSKSYFSEKFNCDKKNIVLIAANDSPFSVQGFGIVLDVKSGNEYDNIISSNVAIENAKYNVYQKSVWHDRVTVTVKMLPWLDVNVKVEYQKKQDNTPHTYIIKQLQHDFSNGTTTITMCRFYSLYQE